MCILVKKQKCLDDNISWSSAQVGSTETQVMLYGTVQYGNHRMKHAFIVSGATNSLKVIHAVLITCRVKP